MNDYPNASEWYDATPIGGGYQHFINTDGRQIWRPFAKPEDIEPPEWRHGKPPTK